MKAEYALYKGEEILHMGTISEIAEKEKVAESTIRFYMTPRYARLRQNSKFKNYRTLVRVR